MYTAENVAVKDGMLVLRTVPQNLTIIQAGKPVDFYVSSGAVNTSGLFERRHGRWEARVALPAVSASEGFTLHSSIWLFDREGSCSQEIDVVEQYTRGSSAAPEASAVGNIHPFSANCTKVPYKREPSTAIGDFTTSYHTFSLDWTPGWISMAVDGKQYAFWNETLAMAAFTDRLFLALTACVMERVPVNALNQKAFPFEYKIDFVRVFEFV